MSNFRFEMEPPVRQFFLAAIFCVSFSTWLTNFFVICIYVSFVFMICIDKKFIIANKLVPSLLTLGFLGLILLGTTWSIAPRSEIWHAVGKYSKLLLIPLGMALSWREPVFARKAIISFIAGAAVLTLSSYLVRFNLMPFNGLGWWNAGDRTNAFVFKNHITFGIIVGFAAVICFAYCEYIKSLRSRIFAVGTGFFFLIPPIFFTQGRSGYVALFVGLLMLLLLRFRANIKMFAVSVLVLSMMFTGFYMGSNNLKMRVDHLIAEFENYSKSKELNSSGTRLSYYQGGLTLIAGNPVLGSGTGSFSEAFAPIAKKIWPKDSVEYSQRHQPHSDLILIGVQFGIGGLLIYFSLLGSLAWPARKSTSYEGNTLLILLAVFFVTSIFNSLLWDVTEGYWFTLLSGCLYGHIRCDDVAEH